MFVCTRCVRTGILGACCDVLTYLHHRETTHALLELTRSSKCFLGHASFVYTARKLAPSKWCRADIAKTVPMLKRFRV